MSAQFNQAATLFQKSTAANEYLLRRAREQEAGCLVRNGCPVPMMSSCLNLMFLMFLVCPKAALEFLKLVRLNKVSRSLEDLDASSCSSSFT
jgi:hypothetical protein